MDDRFAHLTPSQRDAIRTIDRSVLVSAAAGSGKTTVLAERCAALVCDPPARCGIDELLVVTFTDAAAGEMRSRIARAIRARIAEKPRDDYLRLQLHLLDTASISTIHSFCRTVIQRWFPQAGVDPQATVLSGDESELLRDEVLDALFTELYAGEDAESSAFRTLVDDYGAGNDTFLADVVRQIHDFVSSLPDPEAWLRAAADRVDPARDESLYARLDEIQRARLEEELRLQMDFAAAAAERIRACWPIAASRAAEVEEIGAALEVWHTNLRKSPHAEWMQIAAEICACEFPAARRKPSKLPPDDGAAWDAAKRLLDKVKELCKSRLQAGICRFSAEEYREGLARIAPCTRVLTWLVQEFDRRYAAAKTAQSVIDFNDLQRFAFNLLTQNGDPSRPSEVARQLQAKYRYVLVDEFQDVDPLQEAILRMVSRESADPPEGNLFTVGDIKQSIYRFRLAEPTLFARRARRFAGGEDPLGTVIDLQENFRSRRGIVDAVNVVFRALMTEAFGGSVYDRRAELHAGATFPAAGEKRSFETPGVELHVLEPVTEATRTEDENGNENCDEELEGIEREAYLIARRILAWTGRDGSAPMHVADRGEAGAPPVLRPLRYSDVVILLRSLPHKAEPIADILRRMGIPVQLERSDDSLDSTEFRDIFSLLQVLDNARQDLPMAAVLRSPLLGDPLSESDLLRVRLLEKEIPFHEAVVLYARQGPDEPLRERVAVLLGRLDRYRERMRRAPVAEVLWEILQETEYVAYVGGLPDGVRRREHVLRVHELARQFGQFARQGLRRFLRYLEEIAASDRAPAQPSAGGAGEDVVRIMTIHASKGLEFPVVVLADLRKPFNMADCRGTVLIDRELGIGMLAADPERRIRYPTLAHQLAAERVRHEMLSEELRVLYVAMTRAREHLVMVARESLDAVQTCRSMACAGGGPLRVPELELRAASCTLQWVLPALASAPPGAVSWSEEDTVKGALFEVRTYPRLETDAWRIPPAVEEARVESLARIAALEALPMDEQVAKGAPVESILAPLSFVYPGLALTTVPARVSISDLRRRAELDMESDERRPPRREFWAFQPDGTTTAGDAAARGTVTHRFLQHVDLGRACDAGDLREQLAAMRAAGLFSTAEADYVALEDVGWFVGSDLGLRLRAACRNVRREVAFVSRIQPQQYDPSLQPRDHRDVLLIRGVVDAVLCGEAGLEIIDYKTDAIEAAACRQRAAVHRAQLDSYAAAMQGIYQRPVLNRWLVFLHARTCIDLGD